MRKRSYNSLEKDLIDYFFTNNITSEDLKSGTNLTNSTTRPFIKKRIGGSGGFRCYYYLFIIDKKLYITYVHPKAGPLGFGNTTKEKRKTLISNLINDMISEDLLEVTKSKESSLIFSPVKKLQKVVK
jgi:hypothetical protein